MSQRVEVGGGVCVKWEYLCTYVEYIYMYSNSKWYDYGWTGHGLDCRWLARVEYPTLL